MKTAIHFAAALALGATLAAAASTGALAHAKLVKAEPAAGAVAILPTMIDLSFSEEIAGKLSGAVVTDAAGKPLKGDTMMDKGDKGLMVMFKAPLAPGDYKVAWHAVASDDGHKTTGTYSFTAK